MKYLQKPMVFRVVYPLVKPMANHINKTKQDNKYWFLYYKNKNQYDCKVSNKGILSLLLLFSLWITFLFSAFFDAYTHFAGDWRFSNDRA